MKRISLLAILLAFTLASCATKVKLNQSYFKNGKKVGVIYKFHDINTYRAGSQGLLDIALTSGSKYQKQLDAIVDKINIEETISDHYYNLFEMKGKKINELESDFDPESLNKYKGNKASDKKYFKYDVRSYRENGLDELLIVEVKYGVLVNYYGFVVTGKEGFCKISSQIVDLKDNSLVYKNASERKAKLKPKWTPPNYPFLTKSIQEAVDKAIFTERQKLN